MINKIANVLGWALFGLSVIGVVLSFVVPTDQYDVLMSIGGAIVVAIIGTIVLLLNDISISLVKMREQNKKN